MSAGSQSSRGAANVSCESIENEKVLRFLTRLRALIIESLEMCIMQEESCISPAYGSSWNSLLCAQAVHPEAHLALIICAAMKRYVPLEYVQLLEA